MRHVRASVPSQEKEQRREGMRDAPLPQVDGRAHVDVAVAAVRRLDEHVRGKAGVRSVGRMG